MTLLDHTRDEHEEGPPASGAASTLVAITFRDSAGRWWRRTTAGELELLPEKPAYPAERLFVAEES